MTPLRARPILMLDGPEITSATGLVVLLALSGVVAVTSLAVDAASGATWELSPRKVFVRLDPVGEEPLAVEVLETEEDP